MNKPAILTLAGALLAASCSPSPQQRAADTRAALDRYCLDCHNTAEAEPG